MNFNFPPSMNNNNAPPLSDFNPNPNFSYLSQHSIRARFTSAEVRHREFEFPRNPVDIRGSYQRELEKERIRAELIAEEMMRRRILEEEVRREMMMERELALRRGEEGFGIGMGMGMGRSSGPMRIETAPRVPLLTNFEHRGGDVTLRGEVGVRGGVETMPFQRDPGVVGKGYAGDTGGTAREIKEVNGVLAPSEGSSKDKVIIMAKPSANLADIKRKAMTPPVGGSIEVLKKQKSKEDWSCALCRITATSERGLNEHLQGKKHKIRERGMVTKRTGFGIGPSPKMNVTDTDDPFSLPNVVKDNATPVKSVNPLADEREIGVVKEPTDKRKKKFRFLCEICQTGAYSLKVFNAHKRGKKHLRKLSELNNIDKASSVVSSVQKDAPEENEEAEIVAVENKGTAGELVDTYGVDAKINVDLVTAGEQVFTEEADAKINADLVEDKEFLKTVSGETITPMTIDQEAPASIVVSGQKAVTENMEVEVGAETVVMEPVLEIVGVETMAQKAVTEENMEVEVGAETVVMEPVLEIVGVKTMAQKAVTEENMEVEVGAETVVEPVLEIVGVETMAQKAVTEENMEVEVGAETVVMEPVLEIVGETMAPNTTDMEPVCDGIDDMQMVPIPLSGETVSLKTDDQESVPDIIDDMQTVSEPICGETSVVLKTTDQESVCEEIGDVQKVPKITEPESVCDEMGVMQMVPEPDSGEAVAPKTADCDRTDNIEKVPVLVSIETTAPEATDQKSVCNGIDDMQKVPEPTSSETVARKTTDQESYTDGMDDRQKVPEPVSDETVTPKTIDQKFVCDNVDC